MVDVVFDRYIGRQSIKRKQESSEDYVKRSQLTVMAW